jgi:hypothetical protein
MQAGGARSLRAIAAALNERSIRTARGVGDRFFATSEHFEPLIVVMGAGRPKFPLAPYRSADAGTPLRIPYGNKQVALKLGARYGSGGWYAPPGVDLSAFGDRGWL